MDVAEYLAGLQHSRTADIERIRTAILGADAGIWETIKWNAPNFIFAGEDRVTSASSRETASTWCFIGERARVLTPTRSPSMTLRA